jgi:hypothetical protein
MIYNYRGGKENLLSYGSTNKYQIWLVQCRNYTNSNVALANEYAYLLFCVD